MIEEKDYMALESKIICAKCGNHFYLEKEDHELVAYNAAYEYI